MEFHPIELPGKDICNDCGREFEKASDDTIEDRCPRCQAKFRIAMATKALADNYFAWHYRNNRGAKVRYPYLGDLQTGE